MIFSFGYIYTYEKCAMDGGKQPETQTMKERDIKWGKTTQTE